MTSENRNRTVTEDRILDTRDCVLRAEMVEVSPNGVPILSLDAMELMAGEFLGLLGPNGAGKSTLLRVLAGLLKPNRGAVFLRGRPLSEISMIERARMLAWVPQRTETPFEWTVGEMVELGRHPYIGMRARRKSADEEAVARALDQVGLRELTARPIDTLSGGEWQRALLARALAQEPSVLLLDEPVANLDIGYQRQIYELAFELCRKRKVAVIAADHHIDLQARFCDRLVLLSGGRVAARGRADEVLTEEILEPVFHTPIRVEPDPRSGRPSVRWRF